MHRLPIALALFAAGCACEDPPPAASADAPASTFDGEWLSPVPIDLPAVAGNGELDPHGPGLWIGHDRVAVRYLDPKTRRRVQVDVMRFDGRFAPEHRQGRDPHALQIVPLAEALRGTPEPRSAVNLFADVDTPYATIYTLGQSGFSDYRLAVADDAHSAIQLSAPRFGISASDTAQPEREPLGLTVALRDGMVELTTTGADIRAVLGCAPTDPMRVGCSVEPAPATLTAQAGRIKQQFPDAVTVNMTADEDTPWVEVLRAAAAVRVDGDRALFPTMVFAVARRRAP